ncbi:MAG: fibronectin type III domain-containing protein, partial [Anaerolineae bacterium]|nr:fibronectin type III domain-containing protein [Anaerolineae bacterium]
PISNATGIGSYLVSWGGVPLADGYVLEESKDSSFSAPATVYSGPLTSYQVVGRGAARYFYRVKARNAWGDSPWSGTVWTDVVWEAEPNDSAGQANGPILAGITYHGMFPSASDRQDYFYLNLPDPRRVELWLTKIPAGHDYNLVLRDSSLGIVGYSGELSNTEEHILTGILPAGQYYVQVYHPPDDGGSTQAYDLRFVLH